MQFEELVEFKKDLKHLLKKYRTLNDDLEVVKQVLNDEPGESPPFSYRINGLGIETCIFKVKKIACKALKGYGVNSGLRLIYAWFENEAKIVFIELYHKNDKENENKQRILNNFKGSSKNYQFRFFLCVLASFARNNFLQKPIFRTALE